MKTVICTTLILRWNILHFASQGGKKLENFQRGGSPKPRPRTPAHPRVVDWNFENIRPCDAVGKWSSFIGLQLQGPESHLYQIGR